jgi:hypothetical protein
MCKEQYTRHNLTHNMLKKVLIRVDYNGVTNIENWVDTVKRDPRFNTVFNGYNQGYLNQATFDLSKMEEVAKQRSMPMSAFSAAPLHRFFDSIFPGRQDKVTMEIASLFMTFQIDCNNYTNADDYFNYLTTYFDAFMHTDPYIKIERIGIRKISGGAFPSLPSMRETFEDRFFDGHQVDRDNTTMIDREYHDRYMKQIISVPHSEKTVKMNYSTRCRQIEGQNPYQAILDIDGYVDSFVINKDTLTFPADLRTTLDRINDYMFELYKMSVTENYLSQHVQQQ